MSNIKETRALYYIKNKDKVDTYNKEYSIKNKEKLKEYGKEWYKLNKERVKARIDLVKNTDEFKQKRRGYNKKRKESNRSIYYKKRYDISVEDYNRMLVEQNECCAICKISEKEFKKIKNKYFMVDHCHTTGKVRGLLCNNCNAGIGFLKDSTIILSNSISYLNKYNEQ